MAITQETLMYGVAFGSIPHDAASRVQQDFATGSEWVYFKWLVDGVPHGCRLPRRGLDYVRGSWVPVQQLPPPEPASLFAKRELTEEELCDPRLFDPLVYEPILGRMVTPEPLPEWLTPLSTERMMGCLPVRSA